MQGGSGVEVDLAADDIAIVVLLGDHDLRSRATLVHALDPARSRENIVIDLSDCTFVDSTIVAILLALAHGQEIRGASLFVVARPLPDRVRRTLDLHGIPEFLTIHATRETD